MEMTKGFKGQRAIRMAEVGLMPSPFARAAVCYVQDFTLHTLSLPSLLRTPSSAVIVQFTCQKDLQNGKSVHAHIIKAGPISCVYIANTVVNFYAKCGDLPGPHLVFDAISDNDVVSWNSLTNGYSQQGLRASFLIVIELFWLMRAENVFPNVHTFSGVFTGQHFTHFGDRCFRGVELEFQRVPDVTKTKVGYTQGFLHNPSYEVVCTSTTQHLEVVRVQYDPKECNFESLLDLFWSRHDPTTLNRQVDIEDEADDAENNGDDNECEVEITHRGGVVSAALKSNRRYREGESEIRVRDVKLRVQVIADLCRWSEKEQSC
ncbi:hypothetical protein ACFX15_032057 [Malus domestica]